MSINIPNLLTLIRIFVIPIFVIVFYLPFQYSHLAAAIIFAGAAFTDWLDGFLARTLNQSSPFGAFLDPVADKLMVAVTLVLLVGEPHYQAISIPAAIIVGREIVISSLREWMAEVGKQASVKVSYIGKVKTTAQMFALLFLIIYQPGSWLIFIIIGYVLIYLAAILTLWSMILYLKAAWPELNFMNPKI